MINLLLLRCALTFRFQMPLPRLAQVSPSLNSPNHYYMTREYETYLCLTRSNGLHGASCSAFVSTLTFGVFHGLGRAILCNVGGFLAAARKNAGDGAEDVEVQSGLWEGEYVSEMIGTC